MNKQIIYGRNAVLEAMKSERPIERLYLLEGEASGSIREIVALSRAGRLRVTKLGRQALDALCAENGAEGANHQGVVAEVAVYNYADPDDILKAAKDSGEAPFLLLCESIQDPHNLGAIIRSAYAAGAHGVVISKHHAVGLTDAVAKTAAGALEHVPVAQVTNMTDFIEKLKVEGLWIYAADMDGEDVFGVNLSGPVALVIGGEHEGVTRLVKEHCDVVVSLPMREGANSLNASVAAGILMYEVVRARRK